MCRDVKRQLPVTFSATKGAVSDGASGADRTPRARRRSATSPASPASPSPPRPRRSTAATRSPPRRASGCIEAAEQLSFSPTRSPAACSPGAPAPSACSRATSRAASSSRSSWAPRTRSAPARSTSSSATRAATRSASSTTCKALLSRRVDGLIVVGRQTDPRPSLGHDLPVPGRLRLRAVRRPADLSLTPDNVAGGRMAVEHLLAMRPHAASRTSPATPRTPRRRTAPSASAPALARGRARARRRRHVQRVVGALGSRRRGAAARAASRRRRASSAAPTRSPAACSTPLRDLGTRVPDDIAVIGYDNWEVLATNSRPELTSIDANLQQLGRARRAARLRRDRRRGRRPARSTCRCGWSSADRRSRVADGARGCRVSAARRAASRRRRAARRRPPSPGSRRARRSRRTS